MTNVSAVLLSIGTTLGIPAAYFVLLKFPESFSEKVGSMAIFHKSHIAQVEDANHIMSSSQEAADALVSLHNFYKRTDDVNDDELEKHAWLLRVELAKLQGFRGSNLLTNNFVTVAEEKLQSVLSVIDTPSSIHSEKAKVIKFAAYALTSATESGQRNADSNQMLYSAEMRIRQTSIESLKWTLKVAMYGLQAYLVTLALWAGYIFHAYGHQWKAAATISCLLVVFVLIVLRKLTDSSIKASSELLASLKKLIAKGE